MNALCATTSGFHLWPSKYQSISIYQHLFIGSFYQFFIKKKKKQGFGTIGNWSSRFQNKYGWKGNNNNNNNSPITLALAARYDLILNCISFNKSIENNKLSLSIHNLQWRIFLFAFVNEFCGKILWIIWFVYCVCI